MNVKNFARNLKYIFFVFLGILFATFGIEAFLLPNNFIDGGIMGLSMLVAKSFAWNLSLLIILLNIPFLLLAYLKVSIRFAIFSCISISLLSLCLLFVHFPELTKDKLLASYSGETWDYEYSFDVIGLARAGSLTQAQKDAFYKKIFGT